MINKFFETNKGFLLFIFIFMGMGLLFIFFLMSCPGPLCPEPSPPLFDLKSDIISFLKTCSSSDVKSKKIFTNIDRGERICFKDIKDEVPADRVIFEKSEIEGIRATGECLIAEKTLKNKKAILKVRCNNGTCYVSLLKPYDHY